MRFSARYESNSTVLLKRETRQRRSRARGTRLGPPSRLGPARHARPRRARQPSVGHRAVVPRAWLEAQHGHNQTVKATRGWMTPGENAGEDGSGLGNRTLK